MKTPIIPAEENIPAETINKAELDAVFVSHLRYQDQKEEGSKSCTVTCHYMNADSGDKDYSKKAYSLRTGDLDALMAEVPEVANAFTAFTEALVDALPSWFASEQPSEEELAEMEAAAAEAEAAAAAEAAAEK